VFHGMACALVNLLLRMVCVKQGGVISPVLFCIYIDGLLQLLSNVKLVVCWYDVLLNVRMK